MVEMLQEFLERFRSNLSWYRYRLTHRGRKPVVWFEVKDAEIIGYDRLLTVEEGGAVIGYLNDKWGTRG